MEIIGYLILVIAGIVVALFGGGGVLLTTPVLIYFFDFSPLHATTYALFIVAFTSASGAQKMLRSGDIHIGLAVQFALPCFLTIFLVRSLLLPSIPDQFNVANLYLSRDTLIMIPFGLIMLISSLKSLRHSKRSPASHITPHPLTAMLQGLFVGIITGLVGAGGFLITPILHFVMGLEFRKAVGTSLFVVTLNSSFGFLVDIWSGAKVQFIELLLFALAAGIGLIIGFFLHSKVKEEKIKFIFSVILFAVALVILSDYSHRLIKINFL